MDKYLALFEPIAKDMGLEITKIHQASKDLLEVECAYLDFRPMDLDTLEEASRKFSDAIDYEISLDVSSSGAERVMDASRYHQLVGRYVRIVFNEAMQGGDYVEGIIDHYDDANISLSYRVLQKTKSIVIPLENIKTLSLAVKV